MIASTVCELVVPWSVLTQPTMNQSPDWHLKFELHRARAAVVFDRSSFRAFILDWLDFAE